MISRIIVLGGLASFAYTNSVVNQHMLDEIRSANAMWEPAELNDNAFANYTDEELSTLLGAAIGDVSEFSDVHALEAVPTSFDSRTRWGDCIHPIRNQARCGSCWAFGASEALSDRFCIHSKGNVHGVLSAQDLVSCNKANHACNGGWLDKAWKYFEANGIPSEDCEPYKSSGGKVPQCPAACANGQKMRRYKCVAGSTKVARGADATKALIYSSGPVETAFTVYSDFFSYRSGIYHHVKGPAKGGHAVKIIGWGVQGQEKYWIVANSWGAGWGMKGFFHIRENDSGINSATFGCTPDLKQLEFYE
ncbi:cathepsin b [Stylonychia lemnae]|uniref:Cathepsin b n=1 Tax=Stylonychia lemnae TaxID=5949 RepID=A0A078B3D5_STYLE|nr:cathepsin b [Stylonychia lemnae]|eukprot:CDW88954.1 cathepsin b [Stylonychia lemnae]